MNSTSLEVKIEHHILEYLCENSFTVKDKANFIAQKLPHSMIVQH